MKRILLLLVILAAGVAAAELKVGIIGLDTSHAIAFTKFMNVDRNPAAEGFRVTHAYQWGIAGHHLVHEPLPEVPCADA